MRRLLTATLLVLLGAGFGVGLGGCGLRPAKFPTPQSDLDERPGLMSGRSGEFTLYQK